jgi:rubrerythrin
MSRPFLTPYWMSDDDPTLRYDCPHCGEALRNDVNMDECPVCGEIFPVDGEKK